MSSSISSSRQSLPLHGFGVGLRAPHVNEILRTEPELDWFELLADNHITNGGWARQQAYEIAQRYSVTMHCVGMSIGSVDAINFDYLEKKKILANQINPKLISDHLCWTSLHTHYSHDLLPLPYTEEVLNHMANRISIIQDYLGVQIAIENVSAYLTYQQSTIDEVKFVNELAKKADCLILLDVNNVYVNQKNNALNSHEYIERINLDRVAEIHLAGFEDKGHYYLDAHSSRVSKEVWHLYENVLRRNNQIPTLIEWDDKLPEFQILYDEVLKAKAIKKQITSSKFTGAQREEYELAGIG